MKTIQQLIDCELQTSEFDYKQVMQKFLDLRSLESTKGFTRILNLGSILKAEYAAAATSLNAVELIEGLLNVNDLNATFAISASDYLKSLREMCPMDETHNPTAESTITTIANVAGASLYFRWYEDDPTDLEDDDPRLRIYEVYGSSYPSTGDGVLSGTRMWLYIEEELDSEGQVMFISIDKMPAFGHLYNGESFTLDFSSIVDELTNVMISNDCMFEVFRSSAITGGISTQRIINICNTYGSTDAIRTILQAVSSSDQLKHLDVVAVLSNVYRDANALGLDEHFNTNDSNDNYYTPLKTPSYVTDVWAFLAVGFTTAISVVIGIVSKAGAAIISVLHMVWTNVIQPVLQQSDETKALVSRVADVPVWNYPLFTATVGLPNAYSNTYYAIKEAISDYGCAAILDPAGGGSGFGPSSSVFLPSAVDGYFTMQVVPSVPAIDITSVVRPLVSIDPASINVNGFGHLRPIDFDALNLADFNTVGDTQDYLTWDDLTLRRQLSVNLYVYALQLLRSYGYEDTDIVEIPTDYTTVLVNAESVGNNIDVIVDTLKEDGDSISDVGKFAYLIAEMTRIFNRFSLSQISVTWDALMYIMQMPWNKLWLLRRQVTRNATGLTIPGRDVLDPAVSVPNLSRSALIKSVIVGALATAVITGSTLLIRSKLKSKSVGQLALKEKQFADASAAYQASPTADNLKKLGKANKQLSKAWARAGRSGLTSYNGFATSTGTVIPGEEEGGLISNVIDQVSEQYSGGTGVTLTSISRLISGDSSEE